MQGKGLEAAPELVGHILGGLDASGLDKARIVTKSDQEPAIVEMQAEMSQMRGEMKAMGTAEENLRVGDSSSNGRVEKN